MGVSDRAKINADASIKKAELEKQADIERANIDFQKAQALKQAEITIEQQRAQNLITQEQAQTARENYKSSMDSWADVQKTLVSQHYETERDALLNQTNLGLEAIRQVGQTERWSTAWATGLSALVLILIVVVGYLLMHFRIQTARPIYITGSDHLRLGQPYSRNQIIDAVKYPVEVEHER